MAARRWALIIFGLVLLLLGTVFALQGANYIEGSALMSGNPTYIYVGGALALIGLVVVTAGLLSRPGTRSASSQVSATG